MRSHRWARWLAVWVVAITTFPGLVAVAKAAADDPDTLVRTDRPERYQISVSASKLPRRTEEVANALTIVSGDELRRRGTLTLAEALQDVAGFDTGEGSDNGSTVPNLGLWGLKEFDALLVTLDGIPVGGPFNPSLTLIPVADIDRIEIVKGPQGTLYGISAFAGMVQVFTRNSEQERAHAAAGGGSFSSGHGGASYTHSFAEGTRAMVSAMAQNSDGWQDRTPSEQQRGRVVVTCPFGKAQASLDAGGYYDSQRWGSALPVDGGVAIPGFEVDRNYAVKGARLDHHVASGNLHVMAPLTDRIRIENTLGGYQDRQVSVRSSVVPDTASALGVVTPSQGVSIRPIETSVFDELRLRYSLEAGGHHDWVAGGAVTYGRVTAEGEGFDFDQTLGDFSTILDVGSIAAGDLRSFRDRRTFVGVYARDEWTPVSAVTIGGGGRYDNASETLHAQAQEQGQPLGTPELADDKRTDHAWSGDLSAVVRLLPQPTPMFDAVNVYANWKSSFKPAAPNLQEPEGAKILDPERTHSLEAGLKTRALERQVGLDVSWFDMTFENMVVSTLDASGTATLFVNAGKQRFKGIEAELTVQPRVVPGTTISLGYAHHDARFVEFTFVTPGGTLRDVSGKQIELVPRELFNARVDLQAPGGVGVFVAVRTQGKRPLTRRNTFWADPFTEFDAGASYSYQRYHLSIMGRNLGDDRHFTTESEIGDSQFYVAPPRRVSAELSVSI